MKDKSLAYYISGFLVHYLKQRKNYSDNTIKSYRDTIKLFLEYNVKINNKNISSINFELLNLENVNSFLDYLESKGSSINTRNQRLACIKSLCKYILEDNVTYLNQLTSILNITQKKYTPSQIKFLSEEEIKDILSKPDVSNKKGLKELLVLMLLYDGALRISELINLKLTDINLGELNTITIRETKCNKNRIVPISNNTAKSIKQYINIFDKNIYLLESNQKKKYTSNGIRKIIFKYTNNMRFKVNSHTFRHSKASHMLESGIPLIYIRDFLGHSSVTTTEIYAKVNNKIRNKNIIDNSKRINIPIKYDIDNDNDLLTMLKSL